MSRAAVRRFRAVPTPTALAVGLLCSASGAFGQAATAAAPSASAASSAQPASAPEAAAAPQQVSVTGIRSSNLRTIGAKMDSALTIDTVAADQIGQLPDFNVGDALKRVTGVNTLLYQGEPRFVIVRGLDANYNTTLIDGFTLATADVGGRQTYMEMLPSDFASRIDVTKSFLPDVDGGAIGGVVNMVTGNAFNYDDNLVTLSAKGGEAVDPYKYGGAHFDGQTDVKWAKRFGDADQFGLLTTASFWTRHINVPQLETGGALNWYDATGKVQATPYSGNGYAVPTGRVWYNYDDIRTRTGLTTRLDWQPNDKLNGHVSLYDFNQHELANRSDYTIAVASGATDSSQTPTSGNLSSATQTAQLGRLHFDRGLYGVNGELQYEAAPKWTNDVRASYSKATVSNPQTWDNFAQSGLGFGYDWSGTEPTFTPLNPTKANDPKLYKLNYHRQEDTQYVSDVHDFQADSKYNTGADDRGWGAEVGLRSVRTATATTFTRTSWSGAPYTLANVTTGKTLCGMNCNYGIPIINGALADAQFNQYEGSETATVDKVSQFGGDYSVKETVNAAYAQGQYHGDRWLVAGGLRFEETHFDSIGYQATNGTYAPTSSSSSYGKVLPSLLAVLDTTSRSKLRLGISQTLGRPRFDQMATHGGTLVTSGATPTLSVGNPDLKPRLSNNFDIGHDWYLDGGRGIISVALFHKVIKDEIFTDAVTQNMTVGGVPTNVLVTEARNSPNLVRLSGLELGMTKDLTFLPAPFDGLGVSANATFIRAHYPVTLSDGSTQTLSALPEQPRVMSNVAIYYEKGPVHTKLAWNHLGKLWDDRFPNYTPAGFYRNRYQQPTDNLDLQMAYDVSKRLSVSLDILNMTSQGIQSNIGKSQEYYEAGWRLYPAILLGFNAKL
jgi:TonB-dependent receptor